MTREEAKQLGLKVYDNKKPCHKGHNKRYTNNGVCIECSKEYRESSKGKAITKKSQARPEYRKARMAYVGNLLATDTEYRIAANLRGRLNQALKRQYKKGSAVADLGCTVEEFKQYIESLFQPGMSWDNWGRDTWHLDHKRPLASFDLSDREQFLQACHYTNYQPLWAVENLAKRWKEDVAA